MAASTSSAVASGRNWGPRLSGLVDQKLDMLEKMAVGLKKELDAIEKTPRTLYSFEGAVVGTSHVPDRDFARIFGHYRSGVQALLAEQREAVKLQILARKSGESTLTDEQYAEELRLLGVEAVRDLPVDELTAEMQRRGLVVEVPREKEED